MIKANELRRGSIVRYGESYWQVDEIKIDCVELKRHVSGSLICSTRVDYKSLIPILPTGEILYACGFEKSGLFWFIDSSTKIHLRIWEWGILDVTYHTERLAGGYEENDLEITSLHQLQNLYFVKTGEDITMESFNTKSPYTRYPEEYPT